MLNINFSANNPASSERGFSRQQAKPLRFGLLNPPNVTDADRYYPVHTSPGLNEQIGMLRIFSKLAKPVSIGLANAGLGGFEIRSQNFKADADLKKRNDDLMKRLGAYQFSIALEGSKFSVQGGYLPSLTSPDAPSESLPTVIFALGAAGALKTPEPYIQELRQLGYPVVVYQPGLLDQNNKHLGHYLFTSYAKFQGELVKQLDYLMKQLNSGIQTKDENTQIARRITVPFEKQVVVGHSMGGVTALYALAKHQAQYPGQPLMRVIVVAPPESFASAARHFQEQNDSEEKGLFSKFADTLRLKDERAYKTFQGFMDTNAINWLNSKPSTDAEAQVKADETPVLVVGALNDGLVKRDPEIVFESLPFQYKAYAHIRGATHNSVLNEFGHESDDLKDGDERYLPHNHTEMEQPYLRLARVTDDFVRNPEALMRVNVTEGKDQGIVLFG